jgi:hypothetical protein
MQAVSDAFKAAAVATEREIKHKVEITFLDNTMIGITPTFSASSTLDATLTSAALAFNGKIAPAKKYAWVTPVATNLFTDPGFETGGTADWSKSMTGGTVTVATTYKRSGVYGARLTGGGAGFFALTQHKGATGAYNLSIIARRPDGTPVTGADTRAITNGSAANWDSFTPLGDSWYQCEKRDVVWVSDNWGLLCQMDMEIWVDDVQMEPNNQNPAETVYPADDLYPVAGDGSSEIGWWSNGLSDGSGVLSETLEINYNALQTIKTLRVIGEIRLGYPIDFDIHYSIVQSPGVGEWTLLSSVTGNILEDWTATVTPVQVRHLRLTISRFSLSNSHAKVLEFAIGYTIDVTSRVKSFSITKERSATDEATTLPYGNSSANDLTLVLDNTDHAFSHRNSDSPFYGYLKRNRKIRVWLGIVLPDGTVEYTPQGTYYTNGFSAPLSSPEATISARDRAKRMMEVNFARSIVYEGKTISELAEIIALDFGLVAAEYQIGATTDIIPYAYFEDAAYWTHLSRLAAAETGAVYFDETDRMNMENRSRMFSARLSQGTLPRAAFIQLDTVYGLLPNDTIYIDNGIITETAIVAASWNGTTTVTLTAALVSEFIQSSYVYKQAVATTLSESDVLVNVDDQYALDKAKNKIEVKATPLIVPLDGIGQPLIEVIWQLDGGGAVTPETLIVPANSYLNVDVFFQKSPVICNATYPIIFTITTVTPGDEAYITTSWQPSVPYAWGGHLRFTNSKASAVTVIGCRIEGVVLVAGGGITVTAQDAVRINEDGEHSHTVDSKFIQRKAQASSIANLLLDTWKDPVAPVSLDGRGLPHLQLADRIKVLSTDQGLNNHFYLTRIVLDYDGGLTGKYDGIALAPLSVIRMPVNPFRIGSAIGGTDQIA